MNCECSGEGFCKQNQLYMNKRLLYLCQNSEKHRKVMRDSADKRKKSYQKSLVSLVKSLLKSVILWINSGFKVYSKKDRIEICEKCTPHKVQTLLGSTCRLCGCFLWLKTRMPHEACPAGLWGPEPVPKAPPCGKITADEPQLVQIGGLVPRKGGCGCAKS